MDRIKFETRRVRTEDLSVELAAIDPRTRARLAAFFKRETAAMTAQSFGMPEHAARAFAVSQLTDAERSALAKEAERPTRALLDGPKE